MKINLASTLLFFTASIDAFAPANPSLQAVASKTTMHLVPSQGCQLAAASAAALAKEEEEEATRISKVEEKATPNNAARTFIAKMFQRPSGMKLRFPQASERDEDDLVIYPIVGFAFVKLEDGSTRAVPSVNARSECNIDSYRQTRIEPTYGWFSPSCQLDLYAEDEEYCAKKDGDDDSA